MLNILKCLKNTSLDYASTYLQEKTLRKKNPGVLVPVWIQGVKDLLYFSSLFYLCSSGHISFCICFRIYLYFRLLAWICPY